MLTETKGKLLSFKSINIKWNVLICILIEVKFNLVLKRLLQLKKCTIINILKDGFYFSVFHCMSYIVSVSLGYFVGIVNPNLNVHRSFNYQKLI